MAYGSQPKALPALRVLFQRKSNTIDTLSCLFCGGLLFTGHWIAWLAVAFVGAGISTAGEMWIGEI